MESRDLFTSSENGELWLGWGGDWRENCHGNAAIETYSHIFASLQPLFLCIYLFNVELNCKALLKDLLFCFPPENRGQCYLFQKKIISNVDEDKAVSLPQRWKWRLLAASLGGSSEKISLLCFFFLFLFLFPFFFFTFPLFLIPFSEDSFPRERPSDSWSASLFFLLFPQRECQGLLVLLPPWPSSVFSLFCVQLVSCCTHTVPMFVLRILVCVCTLGQLEWTTVADVQQSQLAGLTHFICF